MKIIVFADSHGERELMKSIIREQEPQMVLHLGDYASDCKDIQQFFRDIDIRGVRGNCDFRSLVRESLYINIDNKLIFMTHGHAYNVKYGYDRIIYAAMEKQARILLFGHTHIAYRDIVGGIHILNPGSIGKGRDRTYGIVEIKDGEIETKLVRVGC